MIGNKIADKITKSARNKEQKEDDRIMEETQEIIIPPEKREKIPIIIHTYVLKNLCLRHI